MVSVMMNKAIFLDRDGVINRERDDYTYLKEDFIINEDVIDSLKIFNGRGYLIIVISNQGGIGKKIYSHEQVNSLHQFLLDEFAKNGIEVSEIFYCPHHPDYNGKCLCRKPDSLLFEKAIAKYGINVEKSFMIGDKERDIQASAKVGIKGFLIEANSSLKKIVSLVP
jgi:D-glycero-D-manno-heptose 1,7-bisphosphate phosphatase